jgi:hypothetical protein
MQTEMNTEWSGAECPVAPGECWVDDVTGEHVNATTSDRTAQHVVVAYCVMACHSLATVLVPTTDGGFVAKCDAHAAEVSS